MDTYEKKYNEALKRAKAAIDIAADKDLVKGVAITIFPELRESEDEQIIGCIKKIVGAARHSQMDLIDDEAADAILSWLEKQKEQKSVHTAKEMWKEMRLEVYAQASGNRHEPNYSDDSTKMFSLCDIDEIFEKIGDSTVGSQPVEWSEEDEDAIQQAILALEDRYDEHEPNLSFLGYKLPFNKAAERLKSLRPSWKPSEEDIKMLEHIIWQYETGNKNSKVMGYLPRVEELSFLKKVLSKWKNRIN